jgi:hypothetical protein
VNQWKGPRIWIQIDLKSYKGVSHDPSVSFSTFVKWQKAPLDWFSSKNSSHKLLESKERLDNETVKRVGKKLGVLSYKGLPCCLDTFSLQTRASVVTSHC